MIILISIATSTMHSSNNYKDTPYTLVVKADQLMSFYYIGANEFLMFLYIYILKY